MRTLFVFPNPYAHLDHKGRLAGAIPKPMPAGTFRDAVEHLCAVLKVVPGSYENDAKDGRGEGGVRPSRSDRYFSFGIQAEQMNVSPELVAFYEKMDHDGCIFLVKDASTFPVEKLAKARLAAVAQFKAAYGENAEPDFGFWGVGQFELDELIAEASKSVAEKLAEEAAAEPKRDPVKEAQEAREQVLADAAKEAARLGLVVQSSKTPKKVSGESGKGSA